MAVYKTKNNRWRARISYRDDYGNVKTKSKTFDLKREAQNYETKFRMNLESRVDESVTFNEVKDKFIESVSINANQDTVNEKKRIASRFLSEFNGVKMNRITKKMYLDKFRDIALSDYSYNYKSKIIAQMKAIADFGYRFYNIEDNTKTLPQIKKAPHEHKDMQVWSEEDFNQFIKHVQNEVYAVFFHFLFYTGLRRGEALALQRSDLKGNKVFVNKSIKHFKNGFLPTKNIHSKRKVQLDEVTLKKVRNLLNKNDGEFIFSGHASLGISPIQRTFTKAKKESGVKDIRLHDLRHSHASFLIGKGANIVAVSKRLGHANTKTTLEVYTHLIKESEDELMEILNE